eukprot:1585672-Prymnesium_polylepis.1
MGHYAALAGKRSAKHVAQARSSQHRAAAGAPCAPWGRPSQHAEGSNVSAAKEGNSRPRGEPLAATPADLDLSSQHRAASLAQCALSVSISPQQRQTSANSASSDRTRSAALRHAPSVPEAFTALAPTPLHPTAGRAILSAAWTAAPTARRRCMEAR